MNLTQLRRAMRNSTFLAVFMGLAMGSGVAIAATPADQDVRSMERAQDDYNEPDEQGPAEAPSEGMDQSEDDPAMEDEAEMAEGEEIDFPGAIDDFSEFLDENREQGIEDVASYTQEGTQHMADAIGEVVPDEAGLFEDESAENETLQMRHSAWEDRLGELDDSERLDYSELTVNILTEGTELLKAMQETAYSGASVEDVESALDDIDGEVNISEQGESIQAYFDASLASVEEMYRSTEEAEPVTTRQSAPMAQAEDSIFDWGDDDVPGAVEDFYEFVQENREDGVSHVADYTREGAQHYHDSLAEFINDDQELLNDQLDEFADDVDALETTSRDAYPQSLVNTLEKGTQLLTVIQQAHYEGHSQQVRDVFSAIEQINTNMAIEAQVDTIENAFGQAANTLRSMALDTSSSSPASQADHHESTIQLVANPGEEEPGMEEPGMEEPGAEEESAMTEEVQTFADYAQNLDAEMFSGEDGAQNAVTGLRNLEGALASFVAEGEPAQEPVEGVQYDGDEEPGMEEPGMEEPGMEEPGMEEPGMEEQAREAGDIHSELTAAIDELENNIDSEEFTQKLKESTDLAAELLTAIQEDQYPDGQAWSEQVGQASEAIDGETALEEQAGDLVAFFEANSEVIEQMDSQRGDQPVAKSMAALF